MSARILVVDDVPANLRLLEARLMADYFHVLTADNGEAALSICRDGLCDLVVLDVMMPGMDGFEVCRQLKADPSTTHIPVILVTSLNTPQDRIDGLEAGADDFLTKPVSDLDLITRVKALVRLKMVTDELRMRAATGDELAINHFQSVESISRAAQTCRLAIIDDMEEGRLKYGALEEHGYQIDIMPDANEALINIAEGSYDIAIVSLGLAQSDSLRLCSHLRSIERTRNLPIMVISRHGQDNLVSRALELGINDYVRHPVDPGELRARLNTLMRRKRYNDCLRDSVQQTIQMAVKDPLTELYNRRYFDNQAQTILDHERRSSGAVSIVMIDIDHFKEINDTFGHDIGDEVIRDCARRIRSAVRENDLACRYGGEEFLVVMPATGIDEASIVAERLRRQIAENPVKCAVGQIVEFTISVGVSTLGQSVDDLQKLLKRADIALYDAKRGGRDQVVACVA